MLLDAHNTDVTVFAKALARLAYGYDLVNEITIPYLREVVEKNVESFIAAFPKKCNGYFEHF